MTGSECLINEVTGDGTSTHMSDNATNQDLADAIRCGVPTIQPRRKIPSNVVR